MVEICQSCGGKYERIGMHWTGDCSPPKMSKKQKEIVTGILMGDGYIEKMCKTPRLCINMISPKYLNYVKEKLEPYSKNIKEIKENKFTKNKAYTLRTVSCNEFSDFYNWYESGKKVFPKDINLTPTVLRHWYCCDGSLNRESFRISINNEFGNKNKIRSYFKNADLPEPRFSSNVLYFSKDESKEIFKYVGKSLPDFDYKWVQQ